MIPKLAAMKTFGKWNSVLLTICGNFSPLWFSCYIDIGQVMGGLYIP